MSDQDIYEGLSFSSELKQVGVDGLRIHVDAGTWKVGSPGKHGEAIEVVRRFDASKADSASAKRDAREEETLSIARKALVNSHRANIIAISAIILATVATIIAAVIGAK